jgi:hypothetical protein
VVVVVAVVVQPYEVVRSRCPLQFREHHLE